MGNMNILDNMIVDKYGNDLQVSQRKTIKLATMAWLLNADDKSGRELSSESLGKTIRSLLGSKTNVRSYRMALTYSENSGYLLKKVKPWLWWGIKHDLDVYDLKKQAKRFGIAKQDNSLATMLPMLTFRCKRLMQYKAHKPRKLKEKMSKSLIQVNPYTDKYCRRKLAFISKGHWKWSHQDLCSELVSLAMRDVLTQYPKIENGLHWINIMKSSVNRRGNNLITKATSKNTQGLVRTEDGQFESKTIALPSEDISAAISDENTLKWEQQVFKRAVLSTYKNKEKTALALLAGMPHKKFSQWLGEDSEDFYKKCLSKKGQTELLSTVCKYTGTSEKQMKNLMHKVTLELKAA